MILYHGSESIIQHPDLSHSRTKIDFGAGFYLTGDEVMAKKWVCGRAGNAEKKNFIINRYDLDLTGLKILRFDLTKEWLDFIAANRGYSEIIYDTSEVDVIIGPTADDRIYNTIRQYFEHIYTAEQAVRYLDVAGLSEQIVLKSERAVRNCKFLEYKHLNNKEVQRYRELSNAARKESLDLLAKMTAGGRDREKQEVVRLQGTVEKEKYEDSDDYGRME